MKTSRNEQKIAEISVISDKFAGGRGFGSKSTNMTVSLLFVHILAVNDI